LNLAWLEELTLEDATQKAKVKLTSLGSSIDRSDWNSAEFEKVKDNWFDQNISADINADITSAWNNAIDANRKYIAFRIAMGNEGTYTSKSNYCQIYFYDTGLGGADPHISYYG